MLAMSVIFAATAFSVDLGDYQKRVDSARAGISQLLSNVALEETGEEPDEPDDEIAAHINELIPPTEKIEWPGGAVDTSNHWLKSSLDAFENETDPARRSVLLAEMDERLAAISQKLDELQNSIESVRSKDEDKRKLAEILNRPEYQKPVEKKASVWEEWIRRFLEWLESWFPKFNISPSAFSGLGSIGVVLQYVLIGAIILLIGFVVYKLAPLLAPRFLRKEKKEKLDRIILGERVGENESAADLFGKAERLAREGNLRGAIRKGYVALLCELSDRKVIGLAQHKTNRDYLRDVRSRRELHSEMNGLTGSFEQHWYGFKNTESSDWDDFCDRYRKAMLKL